MTDVIRIALDRRTELSAEVARLEKFIRMAEALVKFDQGGLAGVYIGADDAAPGEPGIDQGSETARVVKPGDMDLAENDPAPVLFQFSPLRKPAPAPAIDQPRAVEPAQTSSDVFVFNERPSADDNVLLLSNPLPKEEAALDVHIGQKLRQRRWMMGMSVEQLGELISVGVDQIKAYEAGSVHIGSSRMWEIASAMEVPMSYFFEDIEGQAPDTGEARGEILSDKEALVLVRDGSEVRTAKAS